MGESSFDIPDRLPARTPERTYAPPRPEPQSRPNLVWRSLGLLLLTAVATNAVGGPVYSACVVAILGAHELGHYLTCRYYRIDASPPYFLPAPDALARALFSTPVMVITGTFGAFIRIRQPINDKRQLFDVGISGPIAGFLVTIPILWFGVATAEVVTLQPGTNWFGEPLLVKFVIWAVHGRLPDGQALALNPFLFATWFGLIATSLNLCPIGQLDGGHISYAVLGRRSTIVSLASVGILLVLAFVTFSWILWAALMVILLIVFGPSHPRTIDEDVPLDPTRMWLAAFALLMFILSFTPVPLDVLTP
jgi:membrane-associated protease RseP (regulator of RpoE activity)